jgi:hypothetical protein
MPEADFRTFSERPVCYSLSLELPVAVGPYAFETTILADGSSRGSWPAGFYAPLGFIPILLYVWCYSRKLKQRRLARAARDPEYAALIAARPTARRKAWQWLRSACGAAMCCCKRRSTNTEEGSGVSDDDGNSENGNGSMEFSSIHSFPGNHDNATAGNNSSDFGSTLNSNSSGTIGHEDDDDDQGLEFPCGASGSRFEALRRTPLYSRLPGQEVAVAGQLAGDFADQKRILDSTEVIKQTCD